MFKTHVLFTRTLLCRSRTWCLWHFPTCNFQFQSAPTSRYFIFNSFFWTSTFKRLPTFFEKLFLSKVYKDLTFCRRFEIDIPTAVWSQEWFILTLGKGDSIYRNVLPLFSNAGLTSQCSMDGVLFHCYMKSSTHLTFYFSWTAAFARWLRVRRFNDRTFRATKKWKDAVLDAISFPHVHLSSSSLWSSSLWFFSEFILQTLASLMFFLPYHVWTGFGRTWLHLSIARKFDLHTDCDKYMLESI